MSDTRQPLRNRLPFVKVSRYADKTIALYVNGWSFHWGIDGPVKVIDGKVVTVRERPRRSFSIYNRLRTVLDVSLWPHRGWCEHGHRPSHFWHRCDYVTPQNPDGRVPDRELNPQDYDENGVHWYDRTCFCELKPEYSICSMHPDDEDEG